MEWTCPVCGGKRSGVWICKDCGFDHSRDCERYATLTPSLPAGACPAASLATDWQTRQAQGREAELEQQLAQTQAELEQLRAARQERERKAAQEEAARLQAAARLAQERKAAQARQKEWERQQAAQREAPVQEPPAGQDTPPDTTPALNKSRKRRFGLPVAAVAVGLLLFLLTANIIVAVVSAALAALLYSIGCRVGAARAARPRSEDRRSRILAALRAALEGALVVAVTFVLFTPFGYIPIASLMSAVIELVVYAVGRHAGRTRAAAEQA
ncbi:MAG: hypothetical protein LUC87_07955 [Clostridiales bacterium]|nr:hypothetical protein [Clostridiales bacterium]